MWYTEATDEAEVFHVARDEVRDALTSRAAHRSVSARSPGTASAPVFHDSVSRGALSWSRGNAMGMCIRERSG